jgi:hypothetical protein
MSTRLIGAGFWVSVALLCYSLPKLRAPSERRAAWAEKFSSDGDPETGEGAFYAGAVGWGNRTLSVATADNDNVSCDELLDTITNGDRRVAEELYARGFRAVRCNGASRDIVKPRPKATPPTAAIDGGIEWAFDKAK